MRATFLVPAWVGRGIITAVLASLALAPAAFGATVLFPKPLHLVRRIEDPLARGAATTVHEYCAGNQIITVNGSRV
ncbi:MAG TPA: hypothetical protein VN181_03195, partial [Thermoanaerobaculia bacterium]|nr:hypothetical protein [Thermoanaerobaculia bacterium]